jgi:hypothetical protein
LFAIFTASAAYGAFENYVTFNMNLAVAQKPTITVAYTLANAYGNSISVLVNSTTKIIQTTEPAYPIFYVNVTNVGQTSIDKISLNSTIPNDWTLGQIRIELIESDQIPIEIGARDFTTVYNPEIGVVMLTFNIKNALGKTFDQYDSLLISLYVQYNLLGQPLPNEYETNPPMYVSTIAVSEWTGNWQDRPTTATLAFATNVIEL